MWRVIFMILFAVTVTAQEYFIVEEPIYRYMIDRYNNEIYYSTYYPNNNGVYRTDFRGYYHTLTEFQSTPVFANNSHQGIIFEWADSGHPTMFLYDFDSNEKTQLCDVNTHKRGYSFSWDDSKFLISLEPLIYYSFTDDSLYGLDKYLYSLSYSGADWFMDNDKLLYFDASYHILAYSLSTGLTDTLISMEGYNRIMGIAYNPIKNILAYSHTDPIDVSIVKIKFLTTGEEYEVYNYLKCDPNSLAWAVQQLKWTPDGEKLSFTANGATTSIDEIYRYDLATNTCNRYTELSGGYKYQLNWLNGYTIAYENATLGGVLMGFKYGSPVSVEESCNTVLNYSLSAYPNPFNPETTIVYELKKENKIEITVYDTLGRKIKDIYNGIKHAGRHSVVFNAEGLASGIYLVALKIPDGFAVQKTTYLK